MNWRRKESLLNEKVCLNVVLNCKEYLKRRTNTKYPIQVHLTKKWKRIEIAYAYFMYCFGNEKGQGFKLRFGSIRDYNHFQPSPLRYFRNENLSSSVPVFDNILFAPNIISRLFPLTSRFFVFEVDFSLANTNIIAYYKLYVCIIKSLESSLGYFVTT